MNHHYLPRFYSNRWISTASKVYSIKNGRVMEDAFSSSKRRGSQEGLYEIKTGEASEKDMIETKYYKPMDDHAARVLEKMINAGVANLISEEKKSWISFLANMLVRHKENVKDTNELAYSIVLEDAHMISPEADLYAIANTFAQHTLVSMATSENRYSIELHQKYEKTLSAMRWIVIDYAKVGVSILTSDYPVLFLHTGEIFKGEMPYQTDWNGCNNVCDLLLTGKFFLCVPLSPQQYFFAFNPNDPLLPSAVSQEIKTVSILRKLNKRMVLPRKNLEIIITNDSSHKRFIEKHFK